MPNRCARMPPERMWKFPLPISTELSTFGGAALPLERTEHLYPQGRLMEKIVSSWPDQKKLAVMVTVMFEVWSEGKAPHYSPMTTSLKTRHRRSLGHLLVTV